MNMKPMLLAALMFAGFLGAAPLDLSSYVTSGRKDTIKNTGLIVTNVDMVGLSAAITQYVGAAASVTSVNGQTGTVTITAASIGAATATQGAKADTAIQPATLATHTNLTLANGAHGGEADTLATVAARGGFAGTETIGPIAVDSQRFGPLSGVGATGTSWGAYGAYAGWGASGNSWGAYGASAGFQAVGNNWGAFGESAGDNAKWTNSCAFGRYAGKNARGNIRIYVDAFNTNPGSGYNSTNDMIFGDAGQLNLGRTGALTNALPNQLRGRWQGNGSEFTGMTVSQIAGAYPASNPSNFVTAASVITNINVNGTVGTVADGIASVTVATSANTNKFWTPLTASAGVAIASNVTAGVTVTTLGLPLYMGDRKICIKRASTNLTDTFTVQLTSIGYGRTTITSAVPINVSGAIITVPAYANNGNLFRAETVPGDGPPANNPSVSADIYLVPTAATLSAGAVSVWFLDE